MNRLLALCVLVTVTTPPKQAHPSTSRDVHKLYLEDQKDRGEGALSLPWDQTDVRDRGRRARVHELLDQGLLKTGQDFHDAAFIYQHGQTADDYLMAHILATVAVAKGDTRSLWISAATLDRYLNANHRPQVFGTQYNTMKGVHTTQEPYDRSLIPDQLREVFCVPSIDQQQANLEEFDAGKYPAGILLKGCSR